MILIVGGTGALGKATAKRLLKQNIPVRIGTRTPEKANDLKDLGAEIVKLDLCERTSLIDACQGADAVLAAAHSIMGSGREASRYVDLQGHKWLIDAANDAGVQQFVYTSAYGAAANHPSSFFRIKYEVEQYLRQSGLSFTILCPTAFMESHVYELIGKPILETGKVTLFGRGENRRNFIAADDVAHYAVLALTNPSLTGRTLDIGGPEHKTNMQVVQLYEKLIGTKVKVSHTPVGLLKVMSRVIRPFNAGLGQIMEVSVVNDTTDQTFRADAIPEIALAKPTYLETWISSNLPEVPASKAKVATAVS